MGERTGKIPMRELIGWDKASLIRKAKATNTSKAKQEILSPLPTGREAFSHSQQSRAPSRPVTQEDKYHHLGLFRAQSHSMLRKINCKTCLHAWLASTEDASNEYRQKTYRQNLDCDIFEGHKTDCLHFSWRTGIWTSLVENFSRTFWMKFFTWFWPSAVPSNINWSVILWS